MQYSTVWNSYLGLNGAFEKERIQQYTGHPKHFLSSKEARCRGQYLINNDSFMEMNLSETSNLHASYKNCGCQAWLRQA